METEKEKEYYIKKAKILLRQFDAATNIIKDILIRNFGESKFQELTTNARKEFKLLIPQIPYIGGKNNDSTDTLIKIAILLPILRSFEQEGLDFFEIGKLTYELFEAFYKIIPPKNDIFNEEYLAQAKERAKNSKLRKYPGDWVFDYVEGDGKTFTYGINYFECGVYKFYKSQGMEHFMSIICIADYVLARVYGYGLKRTQTIGNGAPMCDFRYIKNGSTPLGWPPDKLPEFKKISLQKEDYYVKNP